MWKLVVMYCVIIVLVLFIVCVVGSWCYVFGLRWLLLSRIVLGFMCLCVVMLNMW